MLARQSLAVVLYALLATSLVAQGTPQTILVDFGSPTLTSGGSSPAWNDANSSTQGSALPLLDSLGAASGASLSWAPGLTLQGANSSGTTTPQTGSLLADYPASATRDSLFGSSAVPMGRFVLSGLQPGGVYELRLGASRMSVSDVRTTLYTVQGTNTASGVLDVANNTSGMVQLAGLLPDPTGRLTVTLEADATNTNSAGYFYIGVLELRGNLGGPVVPALGFSTSSLDASMRESDAPVQGNVLLQTNDGSTPNIALSSPTAPSWMSFPATTTPGSLTIGIDPAGLPVGNYSAAIDASVAGGTHLPASLQVNLTIRAPGGPKNLLFYGNSYTIGNGVANLVRLIAVEAGFPEPNVVTRLAGGQTLDYHLNTPSHASAITDALPLGEQWDSVVMQGHSQEATLSLGGGNRPLFITNATAIHQNARNHSPNVRATLYQTWARGFGSGFYSNPYSHPIDMHLEVRTGYDLARQSILANAGPGSVRIAPVGDAFANAGWAGELYTSDTSHPTAKGSLIAAQTLFTALYETPVGGLAPTWDTTSPLVAQLTSLGIDQLAWDDAAELADSVAYGPLNPRPGSGEDLVLLSAAAGGRLTARPSQSVLENTNWSVSLHSPYGHSAGAASLLLVDLPPIGGAANWLGFDELWINPATSLVLFDGPLPTGGANQLIPVPTGLAGIEFLVQGFALLPSPTLGNPLFQATNAQLIEIR